MERVGGEEKSAEVQSVHSYQLMYIGSFSYEDR